VRIHITFLFYGEWIDPRANEKNLFWLSAVIGHVQHEGCVQVSGKHEEKALFLFLKRRIGVKKSSSAENKIE